MESQLFAVLGSVPWHAFLVPFALSITLLVSDYFIVPFFRPSRFIEAAIKISLGEMAMQLNKHHFGFPDYTLFDALQCCFDKMYSYFIHEQAIAQTSS